MSALQRWNTLLKAKRFRESSVQVTTHWNPFDSDYSRVSLSAPFRRMQDKTQVFPFDNNDFVRTRLTHSIEVSGFGRSIGVRIEDDLIQKKRLHESRRGHIPSILAVGGLVHDIGNPPFGHFGEQVFQTYFSSILEHDKELKSALTEEQHADYKYFDGNVQSFRTLTRLGLAGDEFSFNLTFPTLASIVKYPKSSIEGNQNNRGVSYKKFGFFQSEKELFSEINETLELNNRRHPLCFLIEGCDDIAYSASDVEDAVAKKIITIEQLTDMIGKYGDEKCIELKSRISKWQKEYNSHPNLKALIAQNIRIYSQQVMIHALITTFDTYHDEILNGSFNSELLDESDACSLKKFFKEISKCCFNDRIVLKRELLGNTVLSYLLNEFYQCTDQLDFKDIPNTKSGKLYRIISSQFRNFYERQSTHDMYNRMQLAADFTSGMTDSYAVELYSTLTGIQLK